MDQSEVEGEVRTRGWPISGMNGRIFCEGWGSFSRSPDKVPLQACQSSPRLKDGAIFSWCMRRGLLHGGPGRRQNPRELSKVLNAASKDGGKA